MDLIVSIFEHELFLGFYGGLLYYAIIWSLERNRISSENKKNNTRKKFYFSVWLNENYDDMFVTLLIVPLVVVFDDETINVYNSVFEKDIANIGALVYLMSGPVTNMVYLGIKKWREK